MKTLATILGIFFVVAKSSAQSQHGVTAKIITEQKEGSLQIRAAAISTSDTYHSLNYIMVSVKKGQSGSSSNKQSGKFSINPNETKTLAETNFNLRRNDGLKIYLFVKDEETDALLSKDSLEINGAQFAKEISFIPENKLELSGLMIDETKTRIGQQFYDAFFMKYNQLPKKFQGTVTVAELPGFGRSTRVTVMYDDQLVYVFVPRADDEAIAEEVTRTLAILEDYNAKSSVRNNQFKY